MPIKIAGCQSSALSSRKFLHVNYLFVSDYNSSFKANPQRILKLNTCNILITEDDADDRFLLQTAFAERGYPESIHFVENGVELLNYLDKRLDSRKFPTLILLDLNMPKKDGREALREIRENEVFRRIPVYIFTTTHNEQEMARCMKLGADKYVVKPVTFEGLLKFIDEIHEFCTRMAHVQA